MVAFDPDSEVIVRERKRKRESENKREREREGGRKLLQVEKRTIKDERERQKDTVYRRERIKMEDGGNGERKGE